MELVTRLIMGRGQEREGSYRDTRAPPSNTESGLPVVGQHISDPPAPLDEGPPESPSGQESTVLCVQATDSLLLAPGIALRRPHFSWAECERLPALPRALREVRA